MSRFTNRAHVRLVPTSGGTIGLVPYRARMTQVDLSTVLYYLFYATGPVLAAARG